MKYHRNALEQYILQQHEAWNSALKVAGGEKNQLSDRLEQRLLVRVTKEMSQAG
jgi:hypothetical protein